MICVHLQACHRHTHTHTHSSTHVYTVCTYTLTLDTHPHTHTHIFMYPFIHQVNPPPTHTLTHTHTLMYPCTHQPSTHTLTQAYTGDTLFIGSCGRPDLIGSKGHTADEMSRRMFQSLTTKIATLPDHVKV